MAKAAGMEAGGHVTEALGELSAAGFVASDRGLAPEIEENGYFDALVPFGDFLSDR